MVRFFWVTLYLAAPLPFNPPDGGVPYIISS